MYLTLAAAFIVTLTLLKLCFPGWYHKRLVRNMVNEAMAQKRLDAASRNAIRGILETGEHRDLINWIRQNEDKLPGELLAITKKVVNSFARIATALVVILVIIPSCAYIAKHIYDYYVPPPELSDWEAMELLEFLLVLPIIAVVLVTLSSSAHRANRMYKMVLREIAAHNELSDSLKGEARFMLEKGRHGVLTDDWIKHNEGQFSDELLVMTKEAARLGKVCEVRHWVFMLVFLVAAGVVTYVV